MTPVYIGLGSNLQQPEQQLTQAISALKGLAQSELLNVSSFYRSEPMGPDDQPAYINAVAELHTGLEPHELLDELQQIEASQGRDRSNEQRWGPRTLDLDILVYGEKIISSDRLQIPHPGLDQRPFVLYPLQELAPELDVPGMGTLVTLCANCSNDGIEVISANV